MTTAPHTVCVLFYPQCDGWSITCTCGWQGGPFFDTEEEAREDAAAHEATHTP